MKTVILCGGKGTRAYPYTEYLPKPMLPVNGTPIVVQVMRLYAAQGFNEFVLSVGYRKEVIEDYFRDKNGQWSVEIVDTGAETDTAGRIERCRDHVGERFFATYADGLSDVSLHELLEFHDGHQGLATITGVPLPSQYGTMITDGAGRIDSFREKPILRDHWINAGFFVFDRAVFDHWKGSNLERDVFPSLSRDGLVYMHRHDGFFKSMDSFKDQREFEALAAAGDPPWERRGERGRA
ncbi:MAG: sugar phosphate nucleotidyltransferase [Planctomycetota bacterium]